MRPWLLLFLATACTPVPQENRTHFPPDLRLGAVTLRQYQGSALTHTATAPEVGMYRESGEFRARDAGVEVHARQLRFTTRVLTGNAFEGRWLAQGGVRLAGPDGLTGVTPMLSFVRAEGRFGVAASDAGVHLERPDFTLDAQAFVYELGEDRASFDAVTTTSPPPARP